MGRNFFVKRKKNLQKCKISITFTTLLIASSICFFDCYKDKNTKLHCFFCITNHSGDSHTTLNFIKKAELMQDLFAVCRSSESSNIFTGKHPWWRLFLTEVAGLKVIRSNLIKKDSITELFLHGSCAVALFKLLRNFLRHIFAKHFLTKSLASNLQVTTLLKLTCLTKIYRSNFEPYR